MTNYDNFYSGTASTFEKEYSDVFPSYTSLKRIGGQTFPQTANQIEEVNKLLNQGMKTVELTTLSPDIFESIPREHFKEINRLSKLTGNETTLHAPIIDPSGFTDQGWNPSAREEAERRLKDAVIRSHELNPEGNIPVTIHASSLPAGEMREGEMMVAVNQENWNFVGLRKEEREYPGGKELILPINELGRQNKEHWINSTSDLIYYQTFADRELAEAHTELGLKYEDVILGKLKRDDLRTAEEIQGYDHLEFAKTYEDRVEDHFKKIYSQAWKYGDEETREKLGEIQKEWKKGEGTTNPGLKSEMLKNSLIKFREIVVTKSPEIYKPVEEFALEHSAKTLGNVAFSSYEKFKETAPIVSVENFFPNAAFSRAEQLSNLIRESRKVFVENAVEKGISKSEAERQAEKLIGATWDVGHLNLLRKGYDEKEAEKKIMEETKRIAPFVKHVHITDNFGHADTHLPPGMGNVPVKKIMEELEKRGFSGKQIMEAGGFVQHFKVSPFPYALEAMGTPMYYAHMTPKWSDAQMMYGHYSTGYGATFPEQHFGMYGAGFSSLPTELGGQTKGAEGRRFSGTPME